MLLPFYSENCWVTPNEGSLAGQWYYGKEAGDTFDVCIFEDNSVEISYTYNTYSQGYGTGFISGTGPQSMQIVWLEPNNIGISLYRLQDNREYMVESFWADVKNADEVRFPICDDDELNFNYWALHSVNTLKLMSPVQNLARCSRNSNFPNEDFFASPSPGVDESVASVLASSVVILLGFCLLAI